MSVEMNHPFLTNEAAPLLPPVDGVQGRLTALRAADWRQTLGGVTLLAGFVLLFMGWFGVSGTARTADQLSYMAAGGLGGIALVATGLTFMIAYEHRGDRRAIAQLEQHLAELEEALGSEFDAIRDQIVNGAARQPMPGGSLKSAQRPSV
jgi:hypothetical protein